MRRLSETVAAEKEIAAPPSHSSICLQCEKGKHSRVLTNRAGTQHIKSAGENLSPIALMKLCTGSVCRSRYLQKSCRGVKKQPLPLAPKRNVLHALFRAIFRKSTSGLAPEVCTALSFIHCRGMPVRRAFLSYRSGRLSSGVFPAGYPVRQTPGKDTRR